MLLKVKKIYNPNNESYKKITDNKETRDFINRIPLKSQKKL